MGSPSSLTFEGVFKDYSPKLIPSSGQYRMMCPFRENHTASNMGYESFFITPEINAYHCFSCKAKGRLTDLLSTRLKIGLFDAYDLVGVTNIERLFSEPTKREAADIPMSEISNVLPQEYIDRGFSPRVLKIFEVGKRSDGSITIPILDKFGDRIVSLKCRKDNGKDRSFWYEPLFDKENYLYNYHNCIGNTWCVLVEGESDTWRSFQNHVRNTCGIMGGDLSEMQSKLLSVFQTVYLAFDNDYAGILKTEYAYELLRKRVAVRIVLYQSEDPGKADKDEWKYAIENSVDYIQYAMVMMGELGDDYDKIRKQVQKKRNNKH